MNDFVTGLGALTLMFVLIACIPYGIWLLYSVWKKKWQLVIKQVSYPMVYFCFLYTLIYFSDRYAYREYLAGVYACEFTFEDPLYTYYSERHFNGDGYSLKVYPLPDEIRHRFDFADERLLTKFPKMPKYRNKWDRENWRQAPFDSGFDKYLNFALSGGPREKGNSSFYEHLDALRMALEKETTFYAFFKYDHGSLPGNIDFFVVDLEAERVYSINHNT